MSTRPDRSAYFDFLEAVEVLGDGTVRESWTRVYRDYECDEWSVIKPAAQSEAPTPSS